MNSLNIYVCSDSNDAEDLKEIIKNADPGTDYKTRIVDNISFGRPHLVPDIANDPQGLALFFTPATGSPPAPAAFLIVWTEN